MDHRGRARQPPRTYQTASVLALPDQTTGLECFHPSNTTVFVPLWFGFRQEPAPGATLSVTRNLSGPRPGRDALLLSCWARKLGNRGNVQYKVARKGALFSLSRLPSARHSGRSLPPGVSSCIQEFLLWHVSCVLTGSPRARAGWVRGRGWESTHREGCTPHHPLLTSKHAETSFEIRSYSGCPWPRWQCRHRNTGRAGGPTPATARQSLSRA